MGEELLPLQAARAIRRSGGLSSGPVGNERRRMAMDKKTLGGWVIVLAGVVEGALAATTGWGLMAVACALTIVGGAVTLTDRRDLRDALLEPTRALDVRPWTAQIVVPLMPSLAPTLWEVLEAEVEQLRVRATTPEAAERIALRVLSRNGLLAEASKVAPA
jgi:hypothetical protein